MTEKFPHPKDDKKRYRVAVPEIILAGPQEWVSFKEGDIITCDILRREVNAALPGLLIQQLWWEERIVEHHDVGFTQRIFDRVDFWRLLRPANVCAVGSLTFFVASIVAGTHGEVDYVIAFVTLFVVYTLLWCVLD